ncbi:hypothetical protein J7T55_008275 [Diaporthe amygdali]|uniref:uncharacterized protein n=1 Tax=Phomopsis amygdali TaxID=1214568 RepID=UPI0022FED06F|nr:uncharacterized protein J7T55_008275 [Diaporthe amygdali]KAJ0121113.1 hypothetical protein J7T55_008275 [Diaporthe amygdali]
MFQNMTNCPDGVPDPSALPMPSNITFAYVASNDTSNSALVACCETNPISIAESCFAWCEAPPALASEQNFSDCLSINEHNGSRWRHGILGFHEKENGVTVTSPAMSLFMLGIWVLALFQ